MQIMNKYLFITTGIIIVFLGSLISCNSFNGFSTSKDSLEILVVREDGVKNANFQFFKNYFFLPQKTITETELTGKLYNLFDVIYINEKDFSEYFKGYTNIIFLSAKDFFSVKNGQQKWSKDQIVLNFSIDSLGKEEDIQRETEKLINKVKNAEIDRRITNYKGKAKKEINDFIKKEFGSTVSLSNSFFIVDTMDNFIDTRRDFETGTYRFIITEISKNDYNKKPQLINEVNIISKEHIQGEFDGSFAKIDDTYANFYIEKINDKKDVFIEFRGLWKMENDPAPMGGPVLGYISEDPGLKRTFLIAFYIFAPGEDKANHLIEAEAICKSFFKL